MTGVKDAVFVSSSAPGTYWQYQTVLILKATILRKSLMMMDAFIVVYVRCYVRILLSMLRMGAFDHLTRESWFTKKRGIADGKKRATYR
jgi:hypothetical protein